MAAKATAPSQDGTQTTPEVDLELGMNFDQWYRDRSGFRTSPEMVTGGKSCMFGEYAGPEVGENYQDGLSEERMEPTYVSQNAMHHVANPPGRMGAGHGDPGSNKKGTTGYGKSTLRAPQNYRTVFGGDK